MLIFKQGYSWKVGKGRIGLFSSVLSSSGLNFHQTFILLFRKNVKGGVLESKDLSLFEDCLLFSNQGSNLVKICKPLTVSSTVS